MPLSSQDDRYFVTTVQHLYAPVTAAQFPQHALTALAPLIPAELSGYNEVQLRPKRLTVLLDPPEARFPDDTHIWTCHMHEHPVLNHYQRSGARHSYKISDFLSHRQFQRLGLYQEFYRHIRTEYQLATTLDGLQSPIIVFAFNRGCGDFTERERHLLNLLRPHLLEGYRNAGLRSRLQQEVRTLHRTVDALDHGLVVVTKTGHITMLTERARLWLHQYFGKPTRHQPARLPEPLRQWLRQQHTRLSHIDTAGLASLTLTVPHGETRLVIRLLEEGEGTNSLLVLKEEPQTTFSSAHLAPLGLTNREGEILYWVAQGKTNKEVAVLLSLSPHSVRTRLEGIYHKLGVTSRTAAAMKAFRILGLV